jgi:phage baseplate assembly protein W
VRDLIDQLLFTNPGERVNRPDFGSGLLQLIFAPNSPELAAALQFTVQAALQQWLGDVIQVQALEVSSEAKLQVELVPGWQQPNARSSCGGRRDDTST